MIKRGEKEGKKGFCPGFTFPSLIIQRRVRKEREREKKEEGKLNPKSLITITDSRLQRPKKEKEGKRERGEEENQ